MKIYFREMVYDLLKGILYFFMGILIIIGFAWVLSIFGWFFVLEAFVEDGLRIGKYHPLIINKWVVLGFNSAIHIFILISYILINYVEFGNINRKTLKRGRIVL